MRAIRTPSRVLDQERGPALVAYSLIPPSPAWRRRGLVVNRITPGITRPAQYRPTARLAEARRPAAVLGTSVDDRSPVDIDGPITGRKASLLGDLQTSSSCPPALSWVVRQPARIRGHPAVRCGPRETPVSLADRLGEDAAMEVLSSRILLRPSDLARSQAFYGDVLGLGVYREFGRRSARASSSS